MGKEKRKRIKLHITVSEKELLKESEVDVNSLPITMMPPDNLFAGINIDVAKLNTNLTDSHSQKSGFSSKSQAEHKHLSKREKLKSRRAALLAKIDALKQMKLEAKQRLKRSKVSIIGDTNPSPDALPTLDYLKCKPKNGIKDDLKTLSISKPKGTEKASKRKRQILQAINVFKKVMTNKGFQKDPLQTISEHIAAVVQQSRGKM